MKTNPLQSRSPLFALPLLTAAMALATPGLASAAAATSLEDAISGGKASLDLRYRYEFVDQDGKKEANASTLKTRLSLQTLEFQGFSGLLEFDNNSIIDQDNYNDKISGEPIKAQYAVIADPKYSEINQAYLNYHAFDTDLRFGRQRIIYDNQRFIGGVAWRQNEQTFDAFSIVNKSLPNTTLSYDYVYNIDTILATNTKGHHHFVNVNNNAVEAANVSAYAYLLDDISDTYGARLEGKLGLQQGLAAVYALEYATQSENGSAAAYDANYYLIEAGLVVSGVTAKLGYEVQTSDDGKKAFSTPLGTNHAFNGWADSFLATPADGLKDSYLSLATAALGPKLIAAYHQFDSERGSKDYGDEVDFAIDQAFLKHYDVLLKYAHFNGDEGFKDTDKIWLQLEAKF